MASVEINLVRDFAVMAMIISSRVLMVKSLPNIGMRNRVRSSFRRLAIQWSLRCSGRLVDAFPMAWDRLEVIGTEYIHVVQEDLEQLRLGMRLSCKIGGAGLELRGANGGGQRHAL